MVHVIDSGGNPISLDYRYGEPDQIDAEVDRASAELGNFETQFDADEVKLKRMLENYYVRERQAAALRTKLVASQHQYGLTNAMNAVARWHYAKMRAALA